ncbi:dTDP-4-amino-4,6-dideoxygalactose transaminase [Alcanivorax jadensis]|uniref:dTDP-4-amino-4,6-dideoxygalactose transaminase n=1 Tax=Alcanivorax jadensis TaxID=64988 RepID=UPI002353B309|nr:dTDP-4-amino-4,6-dideoxygalactose transaminase [Alcanivorax jadensis]|tara:strand:- start:801 stop:1952 length:1152 start_codon:yes stop_codon:yes gene_type:complete
MTDACRIPFNRPLLLGPELAAIEAAMSSGALAGNGPFTRVCEVWLRKYSGSAGALLVPSCTHALEMAAILINIGPGDEVIMPSWTFVSTANAFVLRGARPVFVDICPDTGNLDARLIEAAITDKTRAIVPVHYGGVACDMASIMGIANQYGLWVIEDAAQALMSTWRDKPLGGIGHLGAFSFHATKNLTSAGEGGALLINDQALLARAELIREKGTDRAAFLRGEASTYEWKDIGSSYLPSECQAAALSVQLEAAQAVTQRRLDIWERYQVSLSPDCQLSGVSLFRVPEDCRHNAHLFAMKMPDGGRRANLQQRLADAGVAAVSHYVPLHSSPAGRRYGRVAGSMRETDCMAECLLRLPLYYALTDAEQSFVIDKVKEGLKVL